ncbi:DUF4097 family beta strand repeat-containing protein [Dyadobacter sp. CY323]|uniref:DUF4097 family beta strand repeat-containing protein n=1 Tax=Dyadobacter sp. CY323 TaxID=2907302 RepID=UPI001F3BBFEA|nr:DUF4097 family beta strand repeat-containing protein [Dyadobacter sp. CY323]MCE6992409.1 DUF4097 domain-containing protein [Dyadobacter sp. CY323]
MKKNNLLLIMLALFASVAVFAQSEKDQPYVTKNFTNASLKELSVETSGGSISVTGGQGAGFKVDMYVRPNNWNGKSDLTKEEIEDRLEDYDILIGTEGNRVVATAKRKNNIKWNDKTSVSIAFKVTTPRNVATYLKTSGGSIHIASLTGEQNFSTSGGSLKINDLDGAIQGRTSGGSIEVMHCRNNIELHTSGGSIKADDLKGNIELKTSGGSIELNNMDGEIYAHTSGGSVRGENISGALNTGTSGGSVRLANVSGSLKANTSAGSIEVELSKLGKYVELSSSAGSVRVTMPLDKGVDLNLKGNRVSIPLKNFDGQAEKDFVRGRMNGGGIPVTLSASAGSVYVNQ